MRYAELKIQEARARVVALHRDIACLAQAVRWDAADRDARKAMDRLMDERIKAFRDFAERIELAETPPELMASA